jgi:hypothetical protein
LRDHCLASKGGGLASLKPVSFTDITGPQGIANRGLLQGDIALGGLAYQQEVSDVTIVPPKALHFEPGVWACVPSTTNPAEPQTVVRMGSIPHGTTINAEGTGFDSQSGQPVGAGPNANAVRMTATFWVEKIKGTDGKVFEQLQYIQRVLLNFSGLSWPHISVATMVVTSES